MTNNFRHFQDVQRMNRSEAIRWIRVIAGTLDKFVQDDEDIYEELSGMIQGWNPPNQTPQLRLKMKKQLEDTQLCFATLYIEEWQIPKDEENRFGRLLGPAVHFAETIPSFGIACQVYSWRFPLSENELLSGTVSRSVVEGIVDVSSWSQKLLNEWPTSSFV